MTVDENFNPDLDERLRSAQRRQMQAIDAHLRAEGLDRPAITDASGPLGSSPRWMLLTATAAAVAVVAIFLLPLLSPEPDSVSTVDGISTSTTVRRSTTTVATATTETTVTTETTTTTVPTETSPTSTPTRPTSTETSTAATDSTVELATPRSTAVCTSGFRAPLELADVAYLSDETGWNRKDDLIDEQDAQYYFNTWEPNYPGVVQVEVVMPQPVMATDLRVAQDPITEVSGVIHAEAAGQSIQFQLEGLGDWQVHTFNEPTLLDRFTLTRSEASANIVEVMICVSP